MTNTTEDEARTNPRPRDKWERLFRGGVVVTREVALVLDGGWLIYRTQLGEEHRTWRADWEGWTRFAKLVQRGEG